MGDACNKRICWELPRSDPKIVWLFHLLNDSWNKNIHLESLASDAKTLRLVRFFKDSCKETIHVEIPCTGSTTLRPVCGRQYLFKKGISMSNVGLELQGSDSKFLRLVHTCQDSYHKSLQSELNCTDSDTFRVGLHLLDSYEQSVSLELAASELESLQAFRIGGWPKTKSLTCHAFNFCVFCVLILLLLSFVLLKPYNHDFNVFY